MVNILNLLEEDGFTFKKAANTAGGEWKGSCPWCGGEDRFTVHPEKPNRGGKYAGGRYVCRQCGEFGDAVTYLTKRRGMKFFEAHIAIGTEPDFHRRPKKPPAKTSEPGFPEPPASPPIRWQRKAEAVFRRARIFLNHSEKAETYRRWLMEERGLNRETMRIVGFIHPGIGGWWARRSWGLEENKDTPDLFVSDGLVIPCYRGDGLQRLRIRRADREPRYVNVTGSNMDVLRLGAGSRQAAVILESDLDALLVYQEARDLVDAVALGAADIRPDRETAGTLASKKALLIALDNDATGIKAAAWWAEHFPNSRRWPAISGAKDPGEMWRRVDVRSWLLAGLEEAGLSPVLEKPEPVPETTPKPRPMQPRPAEIPIPGLPVGTPEDCFGCAMLALADGGGHLCGTAGQFLTSMHECPAGRWAYEIRQTSEGPKVQCRITI